MNRATIAMLALAAVLLGACRAPMSEKLVSEFGHSGDDHRTLEYRVYLPPDYAKDTTRTYPLLVWFHGGGEDEDGWGRVGKIGEIVQDRELKGELSRFIVLAPSAGRFTPIWFGYEKRLIEETLPAVQKRYRTNGQVLAFGHSMGGLSLLMILLRNPGLFDAACIASPFVYDTSAWESKERRAWFQSTFPGTRFESEYRNNQRKYFDSAQDFAKRDPYSLIREIGMSSKLPPLLLTCGDRDNLGLWPHALHLHEVMRQAGIAHDWLPQKGVGHGTVEDPRLMDWLNEHTAHSGTGH
jgi:enterochelin esterase-like enzyme